MLRHDHNFYRTSPRRHSVLNEPTEPIVALSGVGGHSVHGHEDLWCQSQPFDGGGQVWIADGQE
jgi:hypothetical protein